jgi:NAD(P)H dehydrogenase (quinone)
MNLPNQIKKNFNLATYQPENVCIYSYILINGDKMNVLIVLAHPEPNSLNGHLKDIAVETLTSNGDEVKVSDLFAMKFKAVLDEDDFTERVDKSVFNPIIEQYNAVKTGKVPEDVAAEMKKVKWADLIIFQFPVWWTSFPAILKGWIDRVFANGFAFDAAEGKMYTEGLLKGKKALL